MSELDWMAGLLVAIAGYSLRLIQDWLGWWRTSVSDDRHRWKSTRVALLRDFVDRSTDVIALARRNRARGTAAWDDPDFCAAVATASSDWERLSLQATMLVAHRQTLQDLRRTEDAVFSCLPPRSSQEAWDAEAHITAAQQQLRALTHLARSNELGLLPVGIVAEPEGLGGAKRWLHSRRLRAQERRRG